MRSATPTIALSTMLLVVGCPDSGSSGGDSGTSTGQATVGSSSGTPTDLSTTGTPTPPPADSTGSSDGAVDTSTDGGSTDGGSTDEGSSGSTGEPLDPIDCDLAPTMVVSTALIPNARGYHGLAITPDGLIIGSDNSSLIASTYRGDTSVFIPGADIGEQMDWLPDGDIAFVGNSALLRLGLKGTSEVIQSTSGAYGVTIGPDDMAYVVGWNGLTRIDPITGAQENLFVVNGANALHSMGFSPDGSRAYIGTVGDGRIYYVDFDGAMDPTTGLEIFAYAESSGGAAWHDAVAVDACGNLYVPDYNSSNMWRVTPAGDAEHFWVAAQFNDYGHGAVWGTGEHGWKSDALYVPQPYNQNTVTEVVVGVPSNKYEGPVINAVPMRP